jgi:hypothetical protein
VGTSPSPLNVANNLGGVRTLIDPTSNRNGIYKYRVAALNTVGYGAEFPTLTVQSLSGTVTVGSAPVAPTGLSAVAQSQSQVGVTWTDNSSTETAFIIERCTGQNCSNITQIAIAPARIGTGSTTFADTTVLQGTTYSYRVAAVNAAGQSAYSNTAANVTVPIPPTAPTIFTAANGANGNGNTRSVILAWTDTSNNETGFTIQRATNATFTSSLNTQTVATNAVTVTQTGLSRNTQYYYRIQSNNGAASSSLVNATPFPIRTNP